MVGAFPLPPHARPRLLGGQIVAVGSASNGYRPESGSLSPLAFGYCGRTYGGGAACSPPSPASPIGLRAPPIPEERGRRRGTPMMASEESRATATPAAGVELEEESDFDALLSPDGYISICGFGSLLSEKSARSTLPDLRDFRVALLRGFRRVFAHTSPVFFERGIAKVETGEISSLSVEPCEGETLVVTVFEIKRSEIPSFIEREHEFRFLAVVPEDLNGTPYARPAVLCARYSDEEYFRVRCKGSKEIYFQRYGRYNIHKIWQNDILPCRVYLRHCVLAAKNLGRDAYDNFLDHTFTGDRKTTIREHLSTTTGSGIMEEGPPEALKSRYGG